MLSMLKKQMRGILIATILLIIPSFVLFYGAHRTARRPGEPLHAGEVYGRKVTREEYMRSLQRAHISARMRYGDRFESISQFLDLEQQAWRDIVLYEAARRRGIRISDEELLSFITSVPAFQSEEGRFDPGIYRGVLSYALGLRPGQFEDLIRRDLAAARLREKATDGVRASDAEVWGLYSYLNEKAAAEYVLFPAERFMEEIELSGQAVREYFDSNREKFRLPEERKAEYITFRPEPVEFLPDAGEIEAYYLRNIENFTDYPEPEDENGEAEPRPVPLEDVRDEIEETISARRSREAARRKAEEVVLDLEEGFTFWEDLEREETGFFKRDYPGLPRPVTREAFDSEPGELRGPFEAGGVFYLLKTTGRRPSRVPAFEDAEEEARKRLLEERARELALEKAEGFVTAARETEGFSEAAEKNDLEILRTGLFTRDGRIPGLGASPEFARLVFSLPDENHFSAAPVPGGAAAMKLSEIKHPSAEEFEEEKEIYRRYVESEKRERVYRDWFSLILSEAEAKFFLDGLDPPAVP